MKAALCILSLVVTMVVTTPLKLVLPRCHPSQDYQLKIKNIFEDQNASFLLRKPTESGNSVFKNTQFFKNILLREIIRACFVFFGFLH